MLAATRLVLVRSESLARALGELVARTKRSGCIRTGIPLGEIDFRERSWPNDGAWRFLQAGRLIEKKGFATSLRAFADFQREHPRATFTIAGEGPRARNWRCWRANWGLRIAFISPVSSLRRNCARFL